MKIVILTNYFQPKLGYAEYFLAREFNNLGNQVFVVTSNFYFPFPNYKSTVSKVLGDRKNRVGSFIELGVKTCRLPFIFQSKNGAVTLLRGLRRILEDIKPDAVFCDGVFSPLAVQAASCKDKIGFKLVYVTHASTFNTKLRSSFIKRFYMSFFTRIFTDYIKRKANKFVAVGKSERFLLSSEFDLPEKEIQLIHLGADSELFVPNKNRGRSLRKSLSIAQKDIVIIYAGKMTPNKDLDVLLLSIDKVRKKHKNIKLLLVGGGSPEYVDDLKNIIKERSLEDIVIWAGMIDNSELPQYYNASDFGVWPGNLSNTIIEAMSCGLPVILPRRVSQNQTALHLLKNDNGFSFKRGSVSGLAKSIEKSIVGNNIRKMGRKSRKLVEKEYSWKQIANKYLKLIAHSNK